MFFRRRRCAIISGMDSSRNYSIHQIKSFKTKSSDKIRFKGEKSTVPDHQRIVRMGILTLSFYILTNSMQRFAGILSIHGGQPFLAKSTFGIVSTTVCCLLSRKIEELILPISTRKSELRPSRKSELRPSQFKEISDNVIRRGSLSVGVFALLEKKFFLTALPSSVLSIGVHAVRNGKVLSTNPAANQKLVQVLGKHLGCHQCGSKQFFDINKGFIADHMPPTKFITEMNSIWWRKALKLNVEQYIWPQCQKCFRLRGKEYSLIHHHNLQLYHFAPAIAFYLSQSELFEEMLRKISKPISFCARHKIILIPK